MATNAKLWGTGGSAAEDVTKTNCSIVTGYPSVVTAQSNYLVRSITAAPAAQKMVTLTATPSSPTTLTFSSLGGNNLGTKVLSFYVYTAGKQFSGSDKYILYVHGDAAEDNFLVSSDTPVITSNTDAGGYVCWSGASDVNRIKLLSEKEAAAASTAWECEEMRSRHTWGLQTSRITISAA